MSDKLPLAKLTGEKSDDGYSPCVEIYIPEHGNFWIYEDEDFGSVMSYPGDMGSASEGTYSYAFLGGDGIIRRFGKKIAVLRDSRDQSGQSRVKRLWEKWLDA